MFIARAFLLPLLSSTPLSPPQLLLCEHHEAGCRRKGAIRGPAEMGTYVFLLNPRSVDLSNLLDVVAFYCAVL